MKKLKDMVRLYEQRNYPTKASLNEAMRFFQQILARISDEDIEARICKGTDIIALDENGLTFYDFCEGEKLISIQEEEWNNLISLAGLGFLSSLEIKLRSKIVLFQMHDLAEKDYKETYYKKVTELFNQERFQFKMNDEEFCFSVPLSCFE